MDSRSPLHRSTEITDEQHMPSASNTNFTIISSQRGNDLLLLDGYKYTKKRVNRNGQTVWRCTKRKICSGSLVSNGTVIINQEMHKCAASEADNEVIKKLNKCIERAKNETTPVPSIYAEEVGEFNSRGFGTVKKMPPFVNVKKTLYKHRQKARRERSEVKPKPNNSKQSN